MKLRDYFSWSMTPARAELWEKTREKGKIHYVFLRWVMLWGGFMTLFLTIMHFIRWPDHFNLFYDLSINLISCSVGGFLAGVFAWGMAERQYLKFKGKI